MLDRRTSFEQACARYDPAFERTLVEEITAAIAQASMVFDQNVMALRPARPSARSEPASRARAHCRRAWTCRPACVRPSDELAKRIRREAVRAKAKGIGDILGDGKWWGHV